MWSQLEEDVERAETEIWDWRKQRWKPVRREQLLKDNIIVRAI
jgi:hypothetical protein